LETEEKKKNHKLRKIILVVLVPFVLVLAIFHFALDDGDKLVNFDKNYEAPRETANSYYEEWRWW